MRLPPLELLTETPENALWFPVPGMYGGFHLQLGKVADEPVAWWTAGGGSSVARRNAAWFPQAARWNYTLPSGEDEMTISN